MLVSGVNDSFLQLGKSATQSTQIVQWLCETPSFLHLSFFCPSFLPSFCHCCFPSSSLPLSFLHSCFPSSSSALPLEIRANAILFLELSLTLITVPDPLRQPTSKHTLTFIVRHFSVPPLSLSLSLSLSFCPPHPTASPTPYLAADRMIWGIWGQQLWWCMGCVPGLIQLWQLLLLCDKAGEEEWAAFRPLWLCINKQWGDCDSDAYRAFQSNALKSLRIQEETSLSRCFLSPSLITGGTILKSGSSDSREREITDVES